MSDKKKKTEYLLSEIGGIDDKYLLEAESYKAKRKRRIPLSAIAACLVVCFTVVIVMAASNGIFDLASGKSEDMMENEVFPDKEVGNLEGEASEENTYEEHSELDLIFLSYLEEYQGYGSLAELPTERGSTYIIWQYIESGRIFISRPLDVGELKALDKYFGEGEPVGESSPSLKFNVWILKSNGEIVSPYLTESAGNVGNSLFDYEAELIPCEDFISLIADVLN